MEKTVCHSRRGLGAVPCVGRRAVLLAPQKEALGSEAMWHFLGGGVPLQGVKSPLHKSGVSAAAGNSTWWCARYSLFSGGDARRQHTVLWDPAQGSMRPVPHFMKPEHLDWHMGENFLPLLTQGEVHRGSNQGACPPVASAGGSFSSTAFKVVTSRTW